MRLHNTASGKAEPFAPADGKTVKMYVCGPTVYAPPHLGHARSAVVYDTLRRRWVQRGWRVRHVMNFTDMAEEIVHKASLEGRTPPATAERYAKVYMAAMRRLGVLPPTKATWASRCIPAMVEDIGALRDGGHAYGEGGTVFLDTRSGGKLGHVSRLRFEEVVGGTPPVTGRRHPADFVLWRPLHDWGLCWEAPWGCGRPGWHNQCTAMALRTLGPTLDLHGGGIDLAFPHHDSEAAVAEALTGEPLSRFWVHNGHVTVWKQKMSKSQGNFVTAARAMDRHGVGATRLFLLSARYREPLDYDPRAMRRWTALAKAHTLALKAARGAAKRARPSPAWDDWRKGFAAAMDDDLDTPHALALLEEAVRDAKHGAGNPREAAAAARALQEAGFALGLGAPGIRRGNLRGPSEEGGNPTGARAP